MKLLVEHTASSSQVGGETEEIRHTGRAEEKIGVPPVKKKEGIFYQIIVEVLTILKLPFDDPSRKVDQAIKKFKETKGC